MTTSLDFLCFGQKSPLGSAAAVLSRSVRINSTSPRAKHRINNHRLQTGANGVPRHCRETSRAPLSNQRSNYTLPIYGSSRFTVFSCLVPEVSTSKLIFPRRVNSDHCVEVTGVSVIISVKSYLPLAVLQFRPLAILSVHRLGASEVRHSIIARRAAVFAECAPPHSLRSQASLLSLRATSPAR